MVTIRAVLGLLVACLASLASAGSFQVNPIRVDLAASAPTQSLLVRNDSTEPLVVQLSVQAWSQDGGEDRYAPTSDALVTPPIAQIAPGAEQVVRVGLRRAPDATKQLSFRLFVQEIPAAPAPGFAGLQVALRVGIPVFVAPVQPSRRDIGWSAERLPDGALRLTVENRGNVHLQLLDLKLHVPGREAPIGSRQELAYVLAGQARAWILPASWPPSMAGALNLTAYTDAGEIDATLALRQ